MQKPSPFEDVLRVSKEEKGEKKKEKKKKGKKKRKEGKNIALQNQIATGKLGEAGWEAPYFPISNLGTSGSLKSYNTYRCQLQQRKVKQKGLFQKIPN